MAGPCTCRSFCHNLLRVREDRLAGKALIKGSSTNTPTPAISCTSTPAPPPDTIAVPTPNATAALALASINEFFKQFIKTYLEAQA